jgi:tetratricopeptide (TPR) repeat protein
MHQKLGHLDGQATALANLGLCHKTLGDIPKAIDFFRRALAMHEKVGSLDGQGSALANLGFCYLTLGDIPKAIDFLQRSLRSFLKMGLPESHPTVAMLRRVLSAERAN